MTGFSNVQVDAQSLDVTSLKATFFSSMMRNVSSAAFRFSDPFQSGLVSGPGCILASPSRPTVLGSGYQNYVFNWTRDSAIAAFEIVSADLLPDGIRQPLVDYVRFAQTCQSQAVPSVGEACYTIDGRSRPDWPEQSDGPALQTLAVLQAWNYLDNDTQAAADAVISTNVIYLLNQYDKPTTTLWEERNGISFFAQAVQLRCFLALRDSGKVRPDQKAAVDTAIEWLAAQRGGFWNDGAGYYQTLQPQSDGYDPNSDIVLACLYGALPCTDERLLATAAKIRSQWADPPPPGQSSPYYPINGVDALIGIGPLLGRYPTDPYDGDVLDPNKQVGGHPWAVCTCALAQLYYLVAEAIEANSNLLPPTDLTRPFFTQVGIDTSTGPAEAKNKLIAAGDRMLKAVVYHSDFLELSEQFDGTTGYEKSVKNLTWSYASFLSALRTRPQ